MKRVLLKPWAPMRRTWWVWQDPLRGALSLMCSVPLIEGTLLKGVGCRGKRWMASSTASSAICRYVVHFPPATVRRLESETVMRWLRTRDSVFLDLGSLTRGRMPDQAARTSPRRTLMSGAR